MLTMMINSINDYGCSRGSAANHTAAEGCDGDGRFPYHIVNRGKTKKRTKMKSGRSSDV